MGLSAGCAAGLRAASEFATPQRVTPRNHPAPTFYSCCCCWWGQAVPLATGEGAQPHPTCPFKRFLCRCVRRADGTGPYTWVHGEEGGPATPSSGYSVETQYGYEGEVYTMEYRWAHLHFAFAVQVRHLKPVPVRWRLRGAASAHSMNMYKQLAPSSPPSQAPCWCVLCFLHPAVVVDHL